jgi:hypothetical protein
MFNIYYFKNYRRYVKALEIIDSRYPPSMYNIFSDGDNLESDNDRCVIDQGIADTLKHFRLRPSEPVQSSYPYAE